LQHALYSREMITARDIRRPIRFKGGRCDGSRDRVVARSSCVGAERVAVYGTTFVWFPGKRGCKRQATLALPWYSAPRRAANTVLTTAPILASARYMRIRSSTVKSRGVDEGLDKRDCNGHPSGFASKQARC